MAELLIKMKNMQQGQQQQQQQQQQEEEEELEEEQDSEEELDIDLANKKVWQWPESFYYEGRTNQWKRNGVAWTLMYQRDRLSAPCFPLLARTLTITQQRGSVPALSVLRRLTLPGMLWQRQLPEPTHTQQPINQNPTFFAPL